MSDPLDDLIASAVDGGLDAAGRRRLGDLVRDDPSARRRWLEHAQMHALLRSAHGELKALEPRSRRRPLLLAAAAALLAAGTATVLFRPAPPLGFEISTQGESWVQRGSGRLASDEAGPLRVGDRVITGTGSSLEVRSQDGTRLLFREAAEAGLTRDRIELHSGAVRGDVAPRPNALVLATPQAEAVVLGTSFELGTSGGETRLSMIQGLMRLAVPGQEVRVGAGELATTDGRRIVRWVPVCAFDFGGRGELPPGFEPVSCPSELLHTPERRISPAPGGLHFTPEGLVLQPAPKAPAVHGLRVLRWTEEVGEDAAIEVDVAAGPRWTLGLALAGDSFDGFRVIFGVPGNPPGISIDTIHPVEWNLLAADPRPIRYEREHTLRAERYGDRFRVWVDRELRLDTRIAHALPQDRKKGFALSNFGAPPVIRRLRVWKPVEGER